LSSKRSIQERQRILFFKNTALTNSNASLKSCHSHVIRDTFVVESLLAGLRIDRVTLLLALSSVEAKEKHDAPFVKAHG
jgi:integrase/recombinase XerD